MTLSEALYRRKHGTESLNYGREIVRVWALDHASSLQSTPNILDLGPGPGTDLAGIAEGLRAPANMHGLDILDSQIDGAGEKGFKVVNVDIERQRYPFADGSLDIVLANQVIEHTKEIFWVFSEVSRILTAGGLFVVGVPNLASLHNRIALMCGLQPPTIRVLGPHVRGFTRESFIEFAECGGYFKMLEVRGSNFYPFPPWIAVRLARALPTLAVSLYFRIQRTDKHGTFLEALRDVDTTTRYFTGDTFPGACQGVKDESK
jgi:SAM-dependent methyltransferase